MANDLVLRPGLLLGMTYADLQADHVPDAVGTAQMAKGQLGFVRDDYGVRIMRYMHNKNGAVTKAGGLYSRAAVVAIASIDAGSTTTKILKAAGFTANALLGRLMYVKTNSVAGAAPEGESAIITANTAGVLTLDGGRPLTVAPLTATAIDVYSLFDFIASAAADPAVDVFGVGIATNGISDGNWGVLQQYGYCPDVLFKGATAIVAGRAVIADVEQVTASAASAENLFVGFAPRAVNSPNNGKTTIFVNLETPTMLSV